MPQNSVKPLHIAIDARMYGTAQRGIGRYLMKLVEGLEKMDPAPTPPNPPSGRGGNCYTIFLRRANWDEYTPKNPNFKKALWDVPWYGLKEQLFFQSLNNKPTQQRNNNQVVRLFGRSVVKSKIDLVHFPHWNVPIFFRKPFVVTIHDLELFSSNRTRQNSTRGHFIYWLKHLAFRLVFRHAVLASRGIVVPSNVVREQLLDLYRKGRLASQVRKKVQVIYEAPTLNPVVLSVLNNKTTKQQNNKVVQLFSQSVVQSKHYVLYIGAAYPHKNLPRLLEAWKLVHKELPDYKLVLVGREDFFWKKLRLEIGNWELEIADSLAFYGEASDEELATLYTQASLLVQPSLEEGFSLSPLEALSFDCPVAVSDIPVHREILGEAALYFNPRDPHTIASALVHALTNPEARTAAFTHAAAILSRYSWRTHAQQTLHLYEKQKIR